MEKAIHEIARDSAVGGKAGSDAGLLHFQNAPLNVPPSISRFCPVM